MELRTLRLDLARARAALRWDQDALKDIRAQREQYHIELAGGWKQYGSNDSERDRKLAVVMSTDEAYQKQLNNVRTLEYRVDGIEALIADAVDERRANEARIRDKLADALMWNVGADLPSAADDAFDDALASISTETLEAITPKDKPAASATEIPF